jgi:hypothetical protein
MKIRDYNQMMSWLVKRPPETLSKVEKKKIVEDFYKKAEQPKPKPMSMPRYISRINELYGNAKTDEYGNEETATTRIQELDKKPKKKVIKKTLIVEKPTPSKPPIIDYLELQDWLNEVDPNWTDEKPKDEVLLKVPRRELKGLAALLKVG